MTLLEEIQAERDQTDSVIHLIVTVLSKDTKASIEINGTSRPQVIALTDEGCGVYNLSWNNKYERDSAFAKVNADLVGRNVIAVIYTFLGSYTHKDKGSPTMPSITIISETPWDKVMRVQLFKRGPPVEWLDPIITSDFTDHPICFPRRD